VLLDRITKRCVYQSINEVMGNDAMFEAIALGGDDIFIIVPGNRSLEITNKIIEKFDGAFENKMTMSAGICIAKSSTPIRTLFELHSICLKVQKGIQGKTTVLKEQWMFSYSQQCRCRFAGIRKQFVPCCKF